MKYLFLLILCILSMGCAEVELKQHKMTPLKGVLTFYTSAEDKKWGSKTSLGQRAVEGNTVAIDPKQFKYGTKAIIPAFNNRFNNNNIFTFSDTGRDVRSRKASRGQYPVFDIYVNSRRKMYQMGEIMPKLVDVYILNN